MQIINGFKVIRFLGKGKSANSYLIDFEGNRAVLKKFHNEEVSYYKFCGNKIEPELEAYERLKNFGILTPKLILRDIKNNFLIKEFVAGSLASELIARDAIETEIILQLFQYAKTAKVNKNNLDYFPSNFVVSSDKLFYIDYELNPYTNEWNLENWGIFYWANSEGMKNFLSTGDAKFINEDLERGLPVKNANSVKVLEWMKIYKTIDPRV